MAKQYEAIHSGSLSLLGILVAIYTFSYIKYLDYVGRPAYQEGYEKICYIVGVFILVCGVMSIWSYISVSTERSVLTWIYIFSLAAIALFPALIALVV